MKLISITASALLAAFASASPIAPLAELGLSTCESAPNTFSADGAELVASGSASIAENDLVFTADGIPPNELGMLVTGDLGPQVPFRDGFLCLDSNTGVLRLNAFLASESGAATIPLDNSTGVVGLPMAGQRRSFHVLYRDCMSTGAKVNATNGIAIYFQR